RGAFAPSPNSPYATAGRPTALAVADLDEDGTNDVVSLAAASGTVSVLRSSGDGSVTLGMQRYLGNTPSALALADFDADGHTDVVLQNASTHDVVASPSSLDFGDQGQGTTSGPQTVTVSGDGLATRIASVATTADDFAVTRDSCADAMVGDSYPSCTVGVTFTP